MGGQLFLNRGQLISEYTRRYLYCSIFFFSINKIITVHQTMLNGAPVLWGLCDNREFDEVMSIRLWNEVNKEEELLEFDY